MGVPALSTKDWNEMKHGKHALLENLALSCLRVAKVHHLVHEFVDDDKVVADRLLLELLEVLDEDLHEAVQEEDDLRRVRVAF